MLIGPISRKGGEEAFFISITSKKRIWTPKQIFTLWSLNLNDEEFVNIVDRNKPNYEFVLERVTRHFA